MVSTRKKKQQNKRFLSQLSESNAEFMVVQSKHEAQAKSRTDAADRDTSLKNLKNTKGPKQVKGSEVDVHTLEKNIVNKVRSEVDSVMTTVETRVQDAVMTAMENLVIPTVEFAMKSANALSGNGIGSVVLDPDQRDFSVNIEGLQMTASSRINSQTNSNRIGETRDNITVEGSDLLVNKRNFDQQTHSSDCCFLLIFNI